MPVFKALLAVALACLLGASGALAQTAATASGYVTSKGKSITILNVVAVGLDNAEGLLEPNIRMRLVLSDRAVPAEAVLGIAFPPVRDMAKRGGVRGVLIEFDPHSKTSMALTVLDQPADPAQLLGTNSLSDSGGLWQKLDSDPKQVSGHFVSGDLGIDVVFSAPVITDPVVSTVTGAAVQANPLIKLLRARAQALSAGDVAALTRISSRAAAAQFAQTPTPFKDPQFKAYLAESTKSIDHASRIILRGKTAVVLLPDEAWSDFVKEDGEWKIAN